MDRQIVKKFYRDFTAEEEDYIFNLLENMRQAEIEFPPHVVRRMVDRGMLNGHIIRFNEDGEIMNPEALTALPAYQDAVLTFDKGTVYEISNEGIGHTTNPFRIVLAREDSDGYTYFVKVTPQEDIEVVKILDVWRRRGKIPIYPPQHSLNLFVQDWDLIESIDAFMEIVSSQQENGELTAQAV